MERGGITKRDYESGISLSAARGHSATPERPSQAYSKSGRERYRTYLERIGKVRDKVIDRKVRLFSARFKWDEKRARDYIMEGGADVPKPSRKQLEKVLEMSDDEIEELLNDPNIDEQWRFLWYH